MSESQDIPEGFTAPDSLAGPVSRRQPVAWGELDALGHVNHTVYLRWFENARFGWFERVGIAALSYDGVLKPGMVLCAESYVGRWEGGPGVKLEDQVLITEDGYEVLSHYPYEENLLA